LSAVGDGRDTAAALAGTGLRLEEALAGLAELELAGCVRRQAGGRYVVVV
jgi:predicted Rossmann fold nucleotide-binding protein DprA/Smf involved in DNA uptake